MSLNVRITQERSFSTRVSLAGRLDAVTAPELDAKLDGVVNSSAKVIVFDLAHLDYISSAGLRSIFQTQKLLAARSGKVVVVSPQPQVRKVFEIVKDLNAKEKVSFLLAEQNTMVALRYSDFGYIVENGRIVMEGEASYLANNEDVKEFYLGLSGEGRKSFRDVKHYRRRKRWLS